MSHRLYLAPVALGVVLLAGPRLYAASDAGISPSEGPTSGAVRQIRDLLAGHLDTSVDSRTLFDVAPDNDAAVRVEAARLRAVVGLFDPSHVRSGDSGLSDAGSGVPDAAPIVDRSRPDPLLLAQRIALDRARLSFYELPQSVRARLLDDHEKRRQKDTTTRAQVEIGEADQRARQAEADKAQALEEAKHARSEAERLVVEERARLLGLAAAQAGLESDMARARQALLQRAEHTLSFRRRAREMIDDPRSKPTAADALYQELRAWLRSSRNELSEALLATEAKVPSPGEDRLTDLSVEVDRRAVDDARRKLSERAVALEAAGRALRQELTRQLHDEVLVLNADRLALLPRLSEERRAAITGFDAAGMDQAAAEFRQITLVLRYHARTLARWLVGKETRGASRGETAVAGGLVALKWLVATGLFLWWRRRAAPLLTQWRERVDKGMNSSSSPLAQSRLSWLLGVLLCVRRPLEWLVFAYTLAWLLPAAVGGMLEVELTVALVTWTLGGMLAVVTIDAIAAAGEVESVDATHEAGVGLRLRSLRLVGRTVVAFGLILSLSESLVGRGTIHSWVLSTCWLASLPVFLVIIRWWRGAIFERAAHVRKQTAFDQWVVANREGWTSFPAAIAAGVRLFVQGAMRVTRAWLGRFDFARRIHAYLFRRELDKLAQGSMAGTFSPLPEAQFQALSPEIPSATIVASGTDGEVGAIIERINRTGGGVFAVVGERGTGKTTVLGRVRAARNDVVVVDCSGGDPEALGRVLARELGIEEDAGFERAAATIDATERDAGLLMDNAHRLIRPVMGGLAAFDSLLDLARRHSARCTWVFAIDSAIWRFFERSRGARPVFDEVVRLAPWSEENIVALLTSRCLQAGVEPSFRLLVDRLPADADDIDRTEAEARAAKSYYRLLWDFAAGNPGVALHTWRRSLRLDADGRACVKVFQASGIRELEELPDAAVFVLRAVVQLAPARPEEIAQATMVAPAEIDDALRYGLARGYFERIDGGFRVTWDWFRMITRFLQRRHLLASDR
jgi:hypothetical protein